jgi:hypothetical protein
MTKARKAQIAWWAAKICEQTNEYADVIDPHRTRTDRVANKLDAINRHAREIHFELTGKFPNQPAAHGVI